MSDPPREERPLLEGARELGADIDRAAASRMLQHLDLVYLWNRSAGLTAVPRSDAVRLHLLDSLSLLRVLPPDGSLVDLGAGAGFPGIPVALARPRLRVTLVESRRRKCSFLREAVRHLEADNCEVLELDAERLAARDPRFDAVVSRAFRPAPEAATLGARLVASWGQVIVMGGPELDAKTDSWLDRSGPADLDLVVSRRLELPLPGGSERRTLLVLKPAPSSDGR